MRQRTIPDDRRSPTIGAVRILFTFAAGAGLMLLLALPAWDEESSRPKDRALELALGLFQTIQQPGVAEAPTAAD